MKTKIKEDEGILITKLQANVSYLGVVIRREGKKFGLPEAYLILNPPVQKSGEDSDNAGMISGVETVDNSDPLKVVPVKSGKMCVTEIGSAMHGALLDPRCFSVDPGTITYIGDLVTRWKFEGNTGYGQLVFVDNEEETIKEAKEKYSWIFENRPLVKSIPVGKIDTVKGFEEVEELKKFKESSGEQQ